MALSVLGKFYKSAGLLQTGSKKNVAEPTDRSGKTIGDLAPEGDTNTEKYKGAQAESKGILGIMEVISSDFERTLKTVKADEEEANKEFEEFSKQTNDEVAEKLTKTDNKRKQLGDTKDALVEQQGALKD